MLRAIWFSHSQRLVFVASNLKCLSRFNATIAIPIHLNKEMVISALKSISHKTQLLQIHAQILRTNLIGHPYVSLQFLSRVALSGPLQDPTYSQRFFEQINHPSVSHYNTMIRAFSMSHKPQKGLFLYRDMRIRGISPDPLSSTSAIKCCIKFLYLLGGVQVHCNVFKDGHQLDNLLLTAIMDLYSQCRKWDDACKVFDEMPHRDTVAWNVMISCCIRNNRTRDALSLFDVMQSESNRCEPDDVTCLLLLQACAHLNALEFGERIHGYIVDSGYGGALNLSNSLISMYSRCGSLDKLITSMVVEPDSTIWRTLLGACRIHGDVALGERVIGHLIELKAQEAGDYVLLLNIYSSAGHWEKVAEVRKLMKVNAIQTTPGCSTIELKGVVHEFLVDDVSHLRKGEIYEVLDEINKQLKIAGYMVEPSSELHKIDDKEKGYVLSHHSEKLAIAFGVLATPPGTKLRVANNQRICVDCHNFLKLFSEVYNRDVILRDHNRFHHFRGGHCSCTDYW
ncbi:PREDICTED: pentatricopeptide repeat-containing protein At3g47530 isoform X2 [Lupinus angustifolius]|uniref:pentatricopeptide repeat-containing protein At3g47530 isoform X2 n=1 Tax=Lupinus angustifolius TaxID=3871 RepID=UPI00092F56CD|nr:PREDICTED: pentatricopeptide repeat-containing protein At3g47530 isoform X2 [Lupinus angustifolius]